MYKKIIPFFILIIALGLIANWVINKANTPYELPIIKDVPLFSLQSQDNSIFSEKNLNGKITILNFIFTSCVGPCPIMTNYMKDLYIDYSKIQEVQFVSITVDPLVDDIETLSQYAAIYGVSDNRWKFLTGDLQSIKNLKKDGFMLYADELPQGHAIKFILIDQEGYIRRYYDGTDQASIAVLRNDLNNLVKQIRF